MPVPRLRLRHVPDPPGFLTIPKDLRDAAALDGLGHLRFLWDVAVPLARPAIGALALFSFLAAWNQYLWPQLVTTDESHRTVQIGLNGLRQAEVDQLNLVMAGTIIAAIPIVIAPRRFPTPARPRPHRRCGQGMSRRNDATTSSLPRSTSMTVTSRRISLLLLAALLAAVVRRRRRRRRRGWRRGRRRRRRRPAPSTP